MKVWVIEIDDQMGYMVDLDELDAVFERIQDAEPETEYLIRVEEMTKEEFEACPEIPWKQVPE